MNTNVREYRTARENFFARHAAFWPGTIDDPFDILEPYELPATDISELVQAAEAAAALYDRIATLLRTVPNDALLEMGVPPTLLNVVRCVIPGMAHAVLGRLDLVRTNGGYKLLEFNADTPGLLLETFSVNTKVCEEAQRSDPNAGGEAILARTVLDAIRTGLEYVGKVSTEAANIVFTFSRSCRRDGATAEYLVRLVHDVSPLRVQYAPIEALKIDEKAVCDSVGRPVDVLYRIVSLQYLHAYLLRRSASSHTDPDSKDLLFDLVQRRRLALLNPPSTFLLESKAVQVIIWNLFEAGIYFDDHERRMVEKYMIPTYMDPPSAGEPHVIKPVFGAEGDTVSIVNSNSEPIARSLCTTYSNQRMVYQKYVELPTIQVMTEDGPRSLHALTSCFLLAGKPVGICMRAGGVITDESAWLLPVCVAE